MNQKTVIVILGFVVVILISATVYLTTINKASQPVAPSLTVVQQPAPVSMPTAQQPNSSSNVKSCMDQNCNESKKSCEDKGGKFIVAFEFSGGGSSNTCIFDNGRYCQEFGFDKCVESRGMWQPSDNIAPPSGNDN